MKNLMIYINPKKVFEGEVKISVKIQIDNSLRLGWKKSDILLVTNFPYNYRGVKARVIEDDAYCKYFPRCSKWGTIIKLFQKAMIKDDTLYWYHDFDAYQMVEIDESEIPNIDMALCNYGPGCYLFNGGSIFFRKSSEDVFIKTKEVMDSWQTRNDGVECDEVALYKIRKNPDIRQRIKLLNIGYNFHRLRVIHTYRVAIKPIKIIHCHFDNASFLLHGQNKLGVQLVPKGLVTIFNKYGIEAAISKSSTTSKVSSKSISRFLNG